MTNSVAGNLAHYAMTQLNPQAPCDSGRVLTVALTCLAEGSSTLDYSQSVLSNAEGETIAYEGTSGSVVCDAGATGGPSPEPTPSVALLSAESAQSNAGNGLAGIDLQLAYAQGVYGADLSLTFDPTIVQVIDADETTDGIQIAAGSCPAQGLTILNEVDNTNGTIRYALTLSLIHI